MPELSPGWATDLAVLELTGSLIEDRGDHLVVRSPQNPDYHWGNALVVLDEQAVGDAERWDARFRAEFPGTDRLAIGLIRMPPVPDRWTSLGARLEQEDVLTTGTVPRLTARPDGYDIRPLTVDDDWEQAVDRTVRERAGTDEHDPTALARFVRRRREAQRSLCDRGVGAWFGAFRDGRLAADLGIVRCGGTARYQSVATDPAHRRRGLAGHLLGVAARWAAERGCVRWVIVTDPDNPAGRVYRSVGFTPDVPGFQAYRPPGRTR